MTAPAFIPQPDDPDAWRSETFRIERTPTPYEQSLIDYWRGREPYPLEQGSGSRGFYDDIQRRGD